MLLVLKCPLLDEKSLNSHISRLVLSLEVQVVNGSAPGRETPPATDTIFTGTVPDVSDPFIVVDEEESDTEDEVGQKVYAVWKLPVFLSRPRIRLQGPTVVFSASARLKPEMATELNHNKGSAYLPSGMPSGINLLESFSSDPALQGVKPRLSALRVSRVAPVTRQQDLMKHLRAQQPIKLKIYPVVHTRIRFSRPNTAPPSSSVVALLEVDFTPHFDCEIVLDKISLGVAEGTVVSLNDDTDMKLPLRCVSHDHITFLYHITPIKLDIAPKNLTQELDISISATALVTPGSCTPQLSMTWSTTLDFSTPVNPGFGPPTGTGIQRAHRPSQLSIGGQAVTPLKSPSVTRPDALPGLEAASRTEATLPELGITMSFNAPTEPVHPGDVFSWTVYVVNRSSERAARPPRKLALVAVPKRRRNEVRHTRPPSTGSRRRGDKDIADAVLDENVLHAMQKNSAVEPVDIVCLSADTRVGPLAPGACHVAELQFLALQEGVVGIEAIRVVDLGSQEHVDIRELPTMIVEPAAA